MRVPRRVPPRFVRQFLAVVALLAQLVAATGAPVPSRVPSANNKKPGAPFPCQDHPCGCATSEQGWAGDCCCFTLEQKLDWADERGITPPAHVRPMVAARKKAEKPCCAKTATASCCEREQEKARPAPSVRWVVGVFAQKCRGEGFGGLLKLELIVVPEQEPAPRDAFEPTESVRISNSRVTRISLCPPTPPPRLS
jgi:hypothetical protein